MLCWYLGLSHKYYLNLFFSREFANLGQSRHEQDEPNHHDTFVSKLGSPWLADFNRFSVRVSMLLVSLSSSFTSAKLILKHVAFGVRLRLYSQQRSTAFIDGARNEISLVFGRENRGEGSSFQSLLCFGAAFMVVVNKRIFYVLQNKIYAVVCKFRAMISVWIGWPLFTDQNKAHF